MIAQFVPPGYALVLDLEGLCAAYFLRFSDLFIWVVCSLWMGLAGVRPTRHLPILRLQGRPNRFRPTWGRWTKSSASRSSWCTGESASFGALNEDAVSVKSAILSYVHKTAKMVDPAFDNGDGGTVTAQFVRTDQLVPEGTGYRLK